MTSRRRLPRALFVALAAGVGSAMVLFALADRTFSTADAIGSGTMAAAGVLFGAMSFESP
jgi:hypothetical protein